MPCSCFLFKHSQVTGPDLTIKLCFKISILFSSQDILSQHRPKRDHCQVGLLETFLALSLLFFIIIINEINPALTRWCCHQHRIQLISFYLGDSMHSREASKFAKWKGLYIHTDDTKYVTLKDNKQIKSDSLRKFSWQFSLKHSFL